MIEFVEGERCCDCGTLKDYEVQSYCESCELYMPWEPAFIVVIRQ